MILPESPRWLAKKNRWDEATAVLALVHGHGDENSVFVTREMSEIRDEVEFDQKNANVTWRELFKPRMLNRLHIGVFTQGSTRSGSDCNAYLRQSDLESINWHERDDV